MKIQWKTPDGGWNPYLAGALAGVLAVASAFATTKWTGRTSFLGASTTFVRAAGLVQQTLTPSRVEEGAYYKKTAPMIDWQFMVVIGIFLGALASSLTDKSFQLEKVPPIWEQRFGRALWKRALAAVLGGMLAMMGARMADGCPSGHGLSGMMQLSASAFLALAMFFGAGVTVALFVYGRKQA